jgi:hypothetical protein
MTAAHPSTIQCPSQPEEHNRLAEEGKFYVVRGEIIFKGFGSFYEAYMYALNKFGSENFLVQKEDW